MHQKICYANIVHMHCTSCIVRRLRCNNWTWIHANKPGTVYSVELHTICVGSFKLKPHMNPYFKMDFFKLPSKYEKHTHAQQKESCKHGIKFSSNCIFFSSKSKQRNVFLLPFFSSYQISHIHLKYFTLLEYEKGRKGQKIWKKNKNLRRKKNKL